MKEDRVLTAFKVVLSILTGLTIGTVLSALLTSCATERPCDWRDDLTQVCDDQGCRCVSTGERRRPEIFLERGGYRR